MMGHPSPWLQKHGMLKNGGRLTRWKSIGRDRLFPRKDRRQKRVLLGTELLFSEKKRATGRRHAEGGWEASRCESETRKWQSPLERRWRKESEYG